MASQNLRAPSVVRLLPFVGNCRLDVIEGIDTPEKVAEEIRRIIKLPYTAKELWNYSSVVELRNRSYRSPSKIEVKFEAINQLIGACGVECMSTATTDEEAMYINVGEMYAETFIWFRGTLSYTDLVTFVNRGPNFK